MQGSSITPPASPATAAVRAILDSLADLYHLLQDGSLGDEAARVFERQQLAVVAAISLGAKVTKLAPAEWARVGLGASLVDRHEDRLAAGAAPNERPTEGGECSEELVAITEPESGHVDPGSDPFLGGDARRVRVRIDEALDCAHKPLDLASPARIAEVPVPPHAPPEENGAPRGEQDKVLEATPGAGALARTGDPSKDSSCRLQSRHPDLNRRPADYEFAGDGPFSPRAQQLAALAWDLVDRDPQLAARVAFDVIELDEHDPVACTAVCCNSPLALEVRP